MKRFFKIGAVLLLFVMLVGCTQYDTAATEPDVADPYEEESHTPYEQEEEYYAYEEAHEGCHHFYEEEESEIAASWAWDEITFSSVEDFLNAYVIASRGGDIAHLESEWHKRFTDAGFVATAAKVNFTSLDALYLPAGIPDEFEILTITVGEDVVEYIFMHPDDMVSEDATWDALWHGRLFRFMIFRWDEDDSVLLDAMLEQSINITEEDLIGGRYRVDEGYSGYYIDWVYDRTRFSLYIPRIQRGARGEIVIAATEIDGASSADPYELVSFAETTTLNLQDTRAVEAMIAELAARR